MSSGFLIGVRIEQEGDKLVFAVAVKIGSQLLFEYGFIFGMDALFERKELLGRIVVPQVG